MAITTSIAHTYNGIEMLELFMDPVIRTEDFTQYRIMPNVVGKVNIYFRGEANKLVRKHSGTCNSTEKGSIVITDKTIETCKNDFFFGECFTTFDDIAHEREWVKFGSAAGDLTGTEVQRIMEGLIVDGLKRDIPRQIWFSKEGAANEDFDFCDGWFKIMLDGSGTLDNLVDMSDFETGSALNTDAGLDIFEKLIKERQAHFRSVPKSQLRFYVSSGIVENYKQTLRDTSTEFAQSVRVDGIEFPAFDGIPIIEQVYWETEIADATNEVVTDEFTTGSNSAVVLSFAENFIIGLDSLNATRGQDALIGYDLKDDKVYARGKFELGMQVFHHEWVAVVR